MKRMALWNRKGIIITAISGLAGLLVSSKLEEKLNERFNPELLEARDDFKNGVIESMKTNREPGDIFESTIPAVVTEEEETPE